MEKYLEEIIKQNESLLKGSIDEIQGGVVGRIYRIIDKDDKTLILKINKTGTEIIENELVYGSDPSNFKEPYNILRENNIPTPEVFMIGNTNDKEYSYIIMQELIGNHDDYSNEWFKNVGYWLGKLHSIKKPYENSWIDLFKKSLDYRFNNLKELIDKDLSKKIEVYIKINNPKLKPLQSFSFSHLDGFQGICKKTINKWELVGVVDIEDHQYTDQRFVLAGFELNNEMKGNIIPKDFWKEYQKNTTLDSSFEDNKNLFKVYYLIVWSYVFKNDENKFKENISFLSNILNG